MKLLSTAIALTFILTGCVSSQNSYQHQEPERTKISGNSRECPKNGAELDLLKSEAHVKFCLGEPAYITREDEGRHTGLYHFSGGAMIVFLHDASGNVLKYGGYQSGQSQ